MVDLVGVSAVYCRTSRFLFIWSWLFIIIGDLKFFIPPWKCFRACVIVIYSTHSQVCSRGVSLYVSSTISIVQQRVCAHVSYYYSSLV